MAPFDRPYATLYWSAIINIAPSGTVFQGLKPFFCVHEDQLLRVEDELLREEGQTHPVVLSHNDLNVTTVASSGGSMGGSDRPPTKVVSEEFFW